MDIKEFIKDSLLQIVEGITESNGSTESQRCFYTH